MITYHYKCSSCGYEFDRTQSMKVKPEKTCPKCTKQTVERCITGGLGVVFRGSGFYCTDYKKGKKPDA